MKTTIILSSLIIAIGLALSGGIYKVTNGYKSVLPVKTNVFTGHIEVIDIIDLHKLQKAEKKFNFESELTIADE